MRLLILINLLIVSLSSIVVAQSLSVSIPPNTPFSISFDHNLADSVSFRLWCDDSIVKNYTNSEILSGKNPVINTDGTYTITVSAPGLGNGNHNCQMTAFNSIGESAKSETLLVPVGSIPAVPIRLKFVVIISK